MNLNGLDIVMKEDLGLFRLRLLEDIRETIIVPAWLLWSVCLAAPTWF